MISMPLGPAVASMCALYDHAKPAVLHTDLTVRKHAQADTVLGPNQDVSESLLK